MKCHIFHLPGREAEAQRDVATFLLKFLLIT